jgi:hypothetical protein
LVWKDRDEKIGIATHQLRQITQGLNGDRCRMLASPVVTPPLYFKTNKVDAGQNLKWETKRLTVFGFQIAIFVGDLIR